ncbi:MaoC family dehydratase [Pseudonocardia acaciae]|uniref:MaoC family dehydratase n=1 Tax=Pseudonocardia acaciae TaxID=551276 RepID=UPI00056D6259|nr:MaoC family dehydratase [Pseudonocardia acaciae]
MTRSETRLAFGDFVEGRVFELGDVTIDREEMLAFARRFDPQPFHVDPVAAKDNPVLGGLCASGWFTASLWMRAWVDGVLSRTDSLGSPGGGECTWPAPVFPGDVLAARAEILGSRVSRSKPWLGLVDVLATMHRGEDCVFRFRFTALIRVGS